LPVEGGSPAQAVESVGGRYTVTVSTGTSTYVIGWWHWPATVTVTVPLRDGPVSWTAPFEPMVPMTAFARLEPAMAWAPASGTPVHASNASTFRVPLSAFPYRPPRYPSGESL
jgi:hypothetical protein